MVKSRAFVLVEDSFPKKKTVFFLAAG